MRYLWSRFVILILSIEAICFIYNYNFGPAGMQELHKLKDEKQQLQYDIIQLEDRNSMLQEQINEWDQGLFFQEKYAREKLQMQKQGEQIYFR